MSRQRGWNGRVRDFAHTERARRLIKHVQARHRHGLRKSWEKAARKRSLKNKIYHVGQYGETHVPGMSKICPLGRDILPSWVYRQRGEWKTPSDDASMEIDRGYFSEAVLVVCAPFLFCRKSFINRSFIPGSVPSGVFIRYTTSTAVVVLGALIWKKQSFVCVCFVFRSSYFFLVGAFVVLSYPVRWHLICLVSW